MKESKESSKKPEIHESYSEPKRLYRSRKEKIIAGVCGGMGEYLNIDPVWIRIVFVILTLLQGVGILVYIIAWILIPMNPAQKETKQTKAEVAVDRVIGKIDKKKQKEGNRVVAIIGALLVILGLAFLFQYIFKWFTFNYVWPALIVLFGLYLIFRRD